MTPMWFLEIKKKDYLKSVWRLQNDNCIFKCSRDDFNSKESFISMILLLKQKYYKPSATIIAIYQHRIIFCASLFITPEFAFVFFFIQVFIACWLPESLMTNLLYFPSGAWYQEYILCYLSLKGINYSGDMLFFFPSIDCGCTLND